MTSPRAGRPLRPAEILRVVLPAFVGSLVVAVVGVVLALLGHRTVGLAMVAVAALGGMALRTRLVYRAYSRANPPPDDDE